jgi:hypothetical protein
MSVLAADDHSKPGSVSFYAPPRYRYERREAGIRPVLERLSRGEPSPSLLPDISDDDSLRPPDLSILAPDPFSIVGKVATVILCVAVLAAPGVYFFASGGELHISAAHTVATPPADSRAIAQPAATHEPVPAVVEPAASEPAQERSAEERTPDLDVALIAPLKMWGMFPSEAGPTETRSSASGADTDVVAESEASAAQAAPPQRQVQGRHRSPRARPAASRPAGSDTADARTQVSAQKTTPQTAQPNPIQAAFRAIFAPKQ